MKTLLLILFTSAVFLPKIVTAPSERSPLDPERDAIACALYIIQEAGPWDPAQSSSTGGCPPWGKMLAKLAAVRYVIADSLDAALAAATMFGDPEFEVDIIASISAHCSRMGRDVEARSYILEAMKIVDEIDHEPRRILARLRVAHARLAAGENVTTQELVSLLESMASVDPSTWSNQTRNWAMWLRNSGRIDGALELIARIPPRHGYTKAEELSATAVYLARSGELSQAENIAATISDTVVYRSSRKRAHLAIARELASQGQWELAREQARRLRDYPHAEAEILVALGDIADSSGLETLADELGDEAFTLTLSAQRPVWGGNELEHLKFKLACHFARRSVYEKALRSARSISLGNPSGHNERMYLSHALGRVGIALLRDDNIAVGLKLLDESRSIASGFHEPSSYSIYLTQTAKDLEESGFFRRARRHREDAAAAARQLGPNDRAYAFYHLASSMSEIYEEEHLASLREGYEACRSISEPEAQARMLIYLGGTQLGCGNPYDQRSQIAFRQMVEAAQLSSLINGR